MFLFSVNTRSNFSPARKVRSTTEPESIDFSLVRTNAPPLPGFTCWNSTMRQVWPSSSMCIPLRTSFVETGGTARARLAKRLSGRAGQPPWSASTSDALANRRQLLGEGREELNARLPHDREILDPDAADAAQVDAGLDRDDVPRLEHVLGFRREPRRLVDGEADAVPEPVPELVAVARVDDDRAGDRVRLVAGHAGPDALARRDLRLEADVVRATELLREVLARRDGTRAVGAVAVDARAEIGDDQRVLADDRLARLGVRPRAVRSRCDRGLERQLVHAMCVHQLAQAPGELALAPPDPRLGRERLERALRGARGATGRLDLGGVLDRAERLHRSRGRHELEAPRTERLDLRVREHVRLEGDAAVEPLGEVGEAGAIRLMRLHSIQLLAGLDVAEVGVEARAALRVDEQRRVRCLEAREVADVDE